MRMKV
ncbi:hypothetical protein PENARI_c071G05364 [Penicillium arizonense]